MFLGFRVSQSTFFWCFGLFNQQLRLGFWVSEPISPFGLWVWQHLLSGFWIFGGVATNILFSGLGFGRQHHGSGFWDVLGRPWVSQPTSPFRVLGFSNNISFQGFGLRPADAAKNQLYPGHGCRPLISSGLVQEKAPSFSKARLVAVPFVHVCLSSAVEGCEFFGARKRRRRRRTTKTMMTSCRL